MATLWQLWHLCFFPLISKKMADPESCSKELKCYSRNSNVSFQCPHTVLIWGRGIWKEEVNYMFHKGKTALSVHFSANSLIFIIMYRPTVPSMCCMTSTYAFNKAVHCFVSYCVVWTNTLYNCRKKDTSLMKIKWLIEQSRLKFTFFTFISPPFPKHRHHSPYLMPWTLGAHHWV
jgi:hypothetical protein